ncbi:MAG: thiamine biosynthesis protein ThiH [Lentisphaerae bacterium GWF2_45_14]|nr:MAG: thiamine biosynthesis protein ThiH [Lentisphaerae bacterium GWF2_45_14]
MFPYLKISEDVIRARIMNVTPQSVEAVLRKNGCGFDDLLVLLSPAAAEYLPLMRDSAAVYRRMYFGKTIQLYTPLYISSSCVNGCTYCDFNYDNSLPRKTLSLSQIIDEARAIKSMGIDSLLIVAGEDPNTVTPDFLEQTAVEMKKMFSHLSIEIAPQSEETYRRLHKAGVDGLTLFQETFNRGRYAELHPFGPKRDYDYRLEALQRGAAAGMRTLGMAFLLGLYDWRIEAASLAAQAIWIKRKYYRSKIQFTFPRITSTSSGFIPPAPVGDAELEQMILAFRIVFPEYDMTLSTRENKEFRDRAAITCANNMSAGSLVSPGAYCEPVGELGQFSLNDTRTVEEMIRDMRGLGLEPVTKYWDSAIMTRTA